MERQGAKLEDRQLGLFDQEDPGVTLDPLQTAQLATLVEALLIEIAKALATGEAGDEQDCR
jgi:hypothetical protein